MRKPDAEGRLSVPGKVAAALSAALGPADRKYAIVRKVLMVATQEGGGPWGLVRELSVNDGDGPEVAQLLETLAAHELPITGLDLWYRRGDAAGSSTGAAKLLETALAPTCIDRIHALSVLLQRVPLDSAAVRALASAVKRMPRLRDLKVNAEGAGAATIVAAAPPLRSLRLGHVTPEDLAGVSSAPALAALEELDATLDADDAAIANFLRAFSASGLRSLRLARVDVHPAEYRGVAALPSLTSLELLHVSRPGMAAIADARFVPQLKALKLYDAALDDAIAKRIADRGLPALERLDVKFGCPVTAQGLDHLVRAAPQLKHLECPSGIKVRASWVKRGRQIL